MSSALYWFTNDLRLDDNQLFYNMVKHNEVRHCAFVIDQNWFNLSQATSSRLSHIRWQFLKASLIEFSQSVSKLGIELIIKFGSPTQVIGELITSLGINHLYCSKQVGYYEHAYLTQVTVNHPEVEISAEWQYTLFDYYQIETIDALDGSFSKFRNKLEKSNFIDSLTVKHTNNALHTLTGKRKLYVASDNYDTFKLVDDKYPAQAEASGFNGGHLAGIDHLQHYIESGAASTYKQTRNNLDGKRSSTNFSPWLANGCLSPKQVWQAVEEYEQNIDKNESTYWIKFELLWREYFQWQAVKQGTSLFLFKGLKTSPPLTSFHPERYKKWCQGSTPYPLVNALMKQLNQTGFMSNRGRQIVASYFVNELNLDWRYGATYFEQQLIDYDVASNWGNWQYIAGVGKDPRGGRWFNIEKQTKHYDPEETFVEKWNGKENIQPIDSVDASDWPLASSI